MSARMYTTAVRRASPGRATRAAVLLERAAHIIARNGWFCGEYWPGATAREPSGKATRYTDGCPCCPLGALAIAAGFDQAKHASRALDRSELHAAVRVLAETVGGELGDSWEIVAAWNDHATRTATEVIAALRTAARRLCVTDKRTAATRSN